MNKIVMILFVPFLAAVELAYFRIASLYKIIDNPNNRSLHEKPTIRGGGVIFPISLLIYFFLSREASYFFIIAITLVAIVGLLDDIKSLSRTIRFGVQAVAMLLVFYDLNVFAHSWWIIIVLLIIATGTVNAYNFMDGINGITSGYSLVVLMSLYYVNFYLFPFISNDLLLVMIMALIVFSFFNFRKKAICFAGDVGSLSVGFAIIYLILKLSMVSHNYVFVLLLAVYGVDSVLTIIHRLILRQNIFKAHRLHLYQVVISETGMPHLRMTYLYMLVQLMVNVVIIYNLDKKQNQQYIIGFGVLFFLGLMYVSIKKIFYKPIANVL